MAVVGVGLCWVCGVGSDSSGCVVGDGVGGDSSGCVVGDGVGGDSSGCVVGDGVGSDSSGCVVGDGVGGDSTISRTEHSVHQTREVACTKDVDVLPRVLARGTFS